MMKKLLTIFVFFLPLFLAGCQQKQEEVFINTPASPTATSSDTSINTEPVSDQPTTNQSADVAESPATSTAVSVPTHWELSVPFASQAPLGNWDALHEEACEEASMITTAKYFLKQSLDQQIMETEIQRVVAWEGERGYKVDLTAQEAVQVLGDYFGLSARLENDVSVDRIKYELSQGHLIIIPAAGRELGNPNYSGAGPIYHMLVIKGYDSKNFITNDVGTRKGDGYVYAYNTLINAVHDWNPVLAEGGMTDEEMAQGERVIIVVSK